MYVYYRIKKIDNDNIMDNNFKYPLKFLLRRFISSTIALSIALEKVHIQGTSRPFPFFLFPVTLQVNLSLCTLKNQKYLANSLGTRQQ